jgi:hypothetical protein
MKGGLESSDKLAAEDTAEDFDGKKEGAARGDPEVFLRAETFKLNRWADGTRQMIDGSTGVLIPDFVHRI